MQNKLLKKVYMIWLLCFAINIACTDPFAEDVFSAYEEQPIGTFLETIPEYSKWVEMLKKADLFNASNISDNATRYTIFVVNNDGVDAYLEKMGFNSINNMSEDQLYNLLRYHMIPADYPYVSFSNGKMSTTTVSGDYLAVEVNLNGRFLKNSDGTLVEIYVKEDTHIEDELSADAPQINGYYHEIESVLKQPTETIWDKIRDEPKYSIFAAAFKEAGIDEYLANKEYEFEGYNFREHKAILIPTDETMNESGITSLEDLKDLLGGQLPTDQNSPFYKFVAYHVYKGAVDYSELTDIKVGETGRNVESYAAREYLTVKYLNDTVFLDHHGEDKTFLHMKNRDILAYNGFIHEIQGGILPLIEPERYPIDLEFTSFPQFQALAKEKYQMAMVRDGKTYEIMYFDDEFIEVENGIVTIENFRWRTIPFKSEGVLSYLLHDVDDDRFMNDDSFIAFLGSVGWLEITMPMVMKGRYNVKMVKWKYYALNGTPEIDMRGQYQTYINDRLIGSILDNGKNDGLATADLGTYDFLKSGPQVFRFNIVGSDGNGAICLDRIMLTPVN